MRAPLYVLVYILPMALFTACERETGKIGESEKVEVPEQQLQSGHKVKIADLEEKISFNDYHINDFRDRMDLRDFVEYGVFYNEGALKIYKLKNLYRLKEIDYIYTVYLYFIDDVLVKKQAFLHDDEARKLLQDFGPAKLLLRDNALREAYKKEVVRDKKPLLQFLRGKRGLYELNWKLDKSLICYTVNGGADSETDGRFLIDKDHSNAPFKLTVEADDYNRLLRILNNATK